MDYHICYPTETECVTNAKSKLQEYIQRSGTTLPKYTTTRNGGWDHRPQWISTVRLPNGDSYEGEPSKNKRSAEASAAAKALKSTLNQSEIDKRTVSNTTVLLVDVENMPTFIDQVYKSIQGLNIYAFVGKHHCLVDKTFPPGVTKIVSHSSRKDGMDTCMQVYAGYLLTVFPYDAYMIATRDHFGHSLVDIILSPNMIWSEQSITARVVTRVDDIY